MLFTFEETEKKIASGKLLHIAGTEGLIKRLPKGNWVGGSTEYFLAQTGGIVTNDRLFVTEFPYDEFKLVSYDENTIQNVTGDAYENGFAIVILPFDSAVHRAYAANAPTFDGMYIKNIAGWISGFNLGASGQTPVAANGLTGECSPDKAVAAHIRVPDDKLVSLGIVNIFSQDNDAPVITFSEEGFSAKTCSIDGKEVVFADYIAENGIDTRFPLVGDYSGVGVNISFKAIEDGLVTFYAPVFPDIRYRTAKPITNYVKAFNDRLQNLSSAQYVFSCNCILNFLYGELEGKEMETFFGPVTFGEIAYQLVNQTLVYVRVM